MVVNAHHWELQGGKGCEIRVIHHLHMSCQYGALRREPTAPPLLQEVDIVHLGHLAFVKMQNVIGNRTNPLEDLVRTLPFGQQLVAGGGE